MTEAYPLNWPEGWSRTRWHDQESTLQGGGVQGWDVVIKRIKHELRLMGGVDAIVSTNQPIRQDGAPYSQKRIIEDPGAAVYFTVKDRALVIAQDKYQRLVDNLRSIAIALSHFRGLERHGGGHMMDRAFSGFVALPPPTWRADLGLGDDATAKDAEAAFKKRARSAHPDTGGSVEAMSRLNVAIDQAREQLG